MPAKSRRKPKSPRKAVRKPSPPKAPKAIVVAGDLVLDHHLYEGGRPSPQDHAHPGLVGVSEWGGANLLCRLLRRTELDERLAALLAERRRIAEERATDEDRRHFTPMTPKRPGDDDPELARFAARTSTHAAWGPLPDPTDDLATLQRVCTTHAYATFQPTARSGEDKTRVWRVSKALGYGDPAPGAIGGRRPALPPAATSLPPAPAVVCLDDADIAFRHLRGKATGAWCLPPSRGRGTATPPWVVLKLSGDVEQGELWKELARRDDLHDRMVVVVAAQQLRKLDIRLSHGLSWERTVEHLVSEYVRNPAVGHLRLSRHLVVHFGVDAAAWIDSRDRNRPTVHLVFDPAHAEDEWAESMRGGAFAFQTCIAAAVCRMAAHWEDPAHTPGTEEVAACLGTGLSAMRRLRRDGHGQVAEPGKDAPAPSGFPVVALAQELARPSHDFSHTRVPDWVVDGLRAGAANTRWTILGQAQDPARLRRPLTGLARQVVLRGEVALARFPHFRVGKLLSVDRSDMESLRSLTRLLKAYKAQPDLGTRPLSIGVFGPPGAGKSFGVKSLATGLFAPPGAKEYAGWREFNLSQFDGPKDLIGAFHQVRDLILQGLVPVVFWDEFDSAGHKWLQYLLAPMQDGRFQEGELTHTIGKSVFVFAGGTSWRFDAFGVSTDPAANEHFRRMKVPDFKSRLDGTHDVVGVNRGRIPPVGEDGASLVHVPNERWVQDPEDICHPIRRALVLRDKLGLGADEAVDFDPGLLTALVECENYEHGTRSMEKVVQPLRQNRNYLGQLMRPVRHALPAPGVMRQHVGKPDAFHRTCAETGPRPALETAQLRRLAQAIHAYWSAGVRSAGAFNPNLREWRRLSDDTRQSNLDAARRIPDVLAMAGLAMVPGNAGADELAAVTAHLSLHLDLLAEAEHDGWMKSRAAAGWTYSAERDDKRRRHDCMLPYQKLPLAQKRKDRDSVMHYPDIVALVGHKVAFAG